MRGGNDSDLRQLLFVTAWQQKGGVSDVRHSVRHADGGSLLLSASAVPLLADSGEVEGVLATIGDVTRLEMAVDALRESAAAERMLAEWLPAVTYVRQPLGEQGTHLSLGPGIEPVFGYTADEWTGSGDHWKAMIHPDDVDRVLGAWQGHLLGGDWHLAEEYRMRAKDGREVWVLEEAALGGQDGGAQYVGGVIVDITERKRAEEHLRESEQGYRSIFENASFGIFR